MFIGGPLSMHTTVLVPIHQGKVYRLLAVNTGTGSYTPLYWATSTVPHSLSVMEGAVDVEATPLLNVLPRLVMSAHGSGLATCHECYSHWAAYAWYCANHHPLWFPEVIKDNNHSGGAFDPVGRVDDLAAATKLKDREMKHGRPAMFSMSNYN